MHTWKKTQFTGIFHQNKVNQQNVRLTSFVVKMLELDPILAPIIILAPLGFRKMVVNDW